MANQVIHGEALLPYMRKSTAMLSTAVGGTLGPEGHPVILDAQYGKPIVTKDGYKVMNHLKPEEPVVAKIIELLSQATSQANEKAGDGTTTATVLACKMLDVSQRYIASGRSRMKLSAGIKAGTSAAVEYINANSVAVSTQDRIAQIGTIAANGHVEIGKKIAEAMEKVGKEGVITVEEGKTLHDLEVNVVEGMSFDRGYLSSYFVTNNEKMSVEFNDAYVLLLNYKLSTIQPLIPVLEAVVKSGRALVVIAEDIEGEALTSLILNKIRVGLKVVAIKAPGFGDRRSDMLEDLKILTGANYVMDDNIGIKIDDLKLDDLGVVKNIVVTKDNTIMVNGKGDKDAIQERIAQLKKQIEESKSDYDKEKIQERLAKLAGGVAILYVGGATEVQVTELKYRVEDALHATRAAVAEGIVVGGGATLLYAAQALDKLIASTEDEDERSGIQIVQEALMAPVSRIAENAGQNSAVIINKLLESKNKKLVYDARLLKFVDAFDAGIIDPARVSRVALESAASVVAVLVTTEAIVVDIPSAKDDSAASGAGMGGMGGMGGMY